ncbi:hypothetical protein H4219_002101 [Mycoemilia scoparia]|uniref:Small EDRK-rich factor-like N-terminal domain-containing protein n=1 Tax=Mycoemilia scoparia TaxID=417184 RepID=A0A9W8A212_9FUNG|nr:hypothetical protein H4219_002101 [Mycoemilia scoparia]
MNVVWYDIGGNQRELARQKNQKKKAQEMKGKKSEDGMTFKSRQERDAEIMREKQRQKELKLASANGGATAKAK